MAGGPVAAGGGIQGGSTVMGFIIAAFAAFGGLLFGYDTGTISGIIAMEDWLETFGTYDNTGYAQNLNQIPYYLQTSNKSLVVSILSAGTFFGALLGAPMADIAGRRLGLVGGCIVFALGVGLQLDTHWAAFIVGRVFAGLGVGLISCIVPMYQSETAPKNLRGLITGMYQLAITIGALISAIVLNATKGRQNHNAWRIPTAIQFAWAAVLVGGMLILPETPRFLATKGKEEAAKKSLARITGQAVDSELVISQYTEIAAAVAADREESGKSTYKDCFSNNASRHAFRTITGMWLQGFQQLTGINFVIYYGTTFFEAAHVGTPFLITIAVDVVNTGMTIIGINFIDRIGRRTLLLYGAIGMAVCEFLIAIIGTADAAAKAANQTLVAFTCIYVAFYALSWGPIVWTMTGEIFPNETRAKATSLAVASNWLWNWGIGYATPYLVDRPTTTGPNITHTANLGSKVFFIWGATCAACAVFVFFFIPETKGLSLEQVDLLYRESSIIGSAKYGAQMKANGETFGHGEHAHVNKGELEKREHAADISHNDNAVSAV